jgi:hypothetical protein
MIRTVDTISAPLRVFLSYSHVDKELSVRVITHLSALVRDGLIVIWFDRDIPAGQKWRAEIDAALESADIFLALVSADFVASDYCYELEFERALELNEQGRCRIIPVNLRTCDWPAFLREFQALPSFDQAIASMPDPTEGLSTLAHMIRDEVQRMMGPGAPRTTPPAPRLRTAPTVDRALPYLCNRSEQEMGLFRALRVASPRDRRPFVVVTCGDPDECHEAFLTRIRRSPLPRLLGFADKPDATSPVPLNWPSATSRPASPTELFEYRVAACLNTLESDPRRIARQLAPGMTVVDTSIWIDEWSDREEQLLTSYLDYWNAWPPLPAQRAIVLSIAMKYQSGRFDAQAFQKRLDFARWPGLRGVVLDELARIPVGDAQNWAKRSEVRRYYEPALEQELCDEIRASFGKDPMPMNMLAPKLLGALHKLVSLR